MFIGNLSKELSCKFYKLGTDIPANYTVNAEGHYAFSWVELLDTGVDCRIELGGEAFVGAVTVPMTADSGVSYVEIYADGRLSGRYTAETGKRASGNITVPVGCFASAVTVRLKACLKKIVLSSPEVLGSREDGTPCLWPNPKSASYGEGTVTLAEITTASGNADELAAAEFLDGRIRERFGNIYAEGGAVAVVRLGEETALGDDRYEVEVTDEGVTLTAGSRIALMYAADTLVKLYCGDGFRKASISDGPDKPMRGFHFGLPARDQIDFTKRLFKYVLLPLRYNQLFIEFCGGMRFDSHPEISEAWLQGNENARRGLQPPFPHAMMGADGTLLEKDEVRELLDYARELGFEIIPEVQSFGHVQYITYAHPELAEREEVDKDVNDTRTEDERPSNFYTHCYCPSNEDSYKLIFDLIDEIVEVARPQRYVHIGHDEVYHIGLCPRCKGKSHAELYAYHVNRLYSYLKEKGYRTAMWSDMIQPTTKYQTPAAIDMIPKDILCLDFIWYFHLGLDIEDNLIEKGFNVSVGNLYSSHFPRYEKRMNKAGMLGGEVSTWCATNEYAFGKKGKFWDLMMTSELLWRSESYDHRLREVYSRIITDRIQPVMRDEIRGKYSRRGWRSESFAPNGSNLEVPCELLAACPEAVVADGASVRIGRSCDRLVFKQATVRNAPRIPWNPLTVCGSYTVRYQGGETVEVPVEYAGGVMAYDYYYGTPMPGDYYRHTGYVGTWFSDPAVTGRCANGAPLLVMGYVWENPRPEAVIESVSYSALESDVARLIWCGVEARTPACR